MLPVKALYEALNLEMSLTRVFEAPNFLKHDYCRQGLGWYFQ